MRILIFVLLFLASQFFAFAQNTASTPLPSPAALEYFKTSIEAFNIDFENKEVKYILGLSIIKPFNKEGN